MNNKYLVGITRNIKFDFYYYDLLRSLVSNNYWKCDKVKMMVFDVDTVKI